MATSLGILDVQSFPVATATVITAGHAVRLGTGGNLVHAGAAAKDVIGIAQNSSTATSDAAVRVAVIGTGSPVVILGADVTVGDLLTSDASGNLVEASTGETFIGIATETGVDGQSIRMVGARGVA